MIGVLFGVAVTVGAVGVAVALLRPPSRRPLPLWVYSSEPSFVDWSSDPPIVRLFPSLYSDPPTDDDYNDPTAAPEIVPQPLSLSLVIPAYNEKARLPGTLDEVLPFLRSKSSESDGSFTFEVIVVDDGSRDGDATYEAAEAAARKWKPHVRVLRLVRNRGKGGAVRRGVACARGAVIAFADADGATDIRDLDAVMAALSGSGSDCGVAIGSRRCITEGATVSRGVFRSLLAGGFSTLVSTLCVRGVRDTQCGFKAFTRASAAAIFPSVHIERWAFDVEVLFLAQRLGIRIAEVPVRWHEVAGSKLSPFSASLQMARDILRIRVLYSLGIWSSSH